MKALDQAIKLKREIDALEEQKRDLERQLNSLRREVEPRAQYGNLRVRVEERQGRETLYLTTFLLNDDERVRHMDLFGQISGEWRESRHSVGYYRNEDGVLVHEGGGWLLITDCRLCSDEEWEDIKSGYIPEKFQNKNM